MAHVEVCTDELDRDEYVANTGNRCFHCKSALFDAIGPLATMMNASMALGTNLDDLGDHRPGQAAAISRGAVFPLVDAGLSKADVRAISAELGLSTADKPAAACLSSRIAYGDEVTSQLLSRIERAAVRLGFATVDVDRERRQGLPEVVYGSGKSAAEIAGIVSVLLELSAGPVLVTRVDACLLYTSDAAESTLCRSR